MRLGLDMGLGGVATASRPAGYAGHNGVDNLLLEDGSNILLEDGSSVLLKE